MTAVEAGKEIKWMRNILTEFRYPLFSTLILFIDNKFKNRGHQEPRALLMHETSGFVTLLAYKCNSRLSHYSSICFFITKCG